MKKRLRYGYAVFSALFLLSGMMATAAGNDARRLIQTVDEEDVCKGMIRLGLLEGMACGEGNLEDAMEAVKPSLAKIQMAGRFGSGTILRITEEEVIVVSSRHLLELDNTCFVTLYTQDVVEGSVFGLSDRYDVGFVRIPLSLLPYDSIMQLRYSTFSGQCVKLLQKGDEMFLAGSVDGIAQNLYAGSILHMAWHVEGFDPPMLYTYCYAKEGMSGGGAYDIHGHYIGMLAGGYGEETVSLPAVLVMEAYEAASQP